MITAFNKRMADGMREHGLDPSKYIDKETEQVKVLTVEEKLNMALGKYKPIQNLPRAKRQPSTFKKK